MDRNYLMFGLLIFQLVLFTIAVLYKKEGNRRVHFFIIFILAFIAVIHAFSYNTDAEDMYIALRYVKNFIDGRGLVFNTFDKVEGYSDFFWVVLIAGIHKIVNYDIPLTARYLSLTVSVITLIYTYYLSFKLTQNRLISYLASFLVSISGSYACYGLSGLENPLYALFILLIINYSIERKWMLAGLFIGLIMMTRPEGFIMGVPVVMFIFIQDYSLKDKVKYCLMVGVFAAIPIVPWTIWRVSYYGYFIPNTIAAKEGMNMIYQVKSGFTYSVYFLAIISESLLALLILPIINYFYTQQKIKTIIVDKNLILVLFTSALFILFYTYAGGDWMPGWRFYASLVPLFSLAIALIWNNCVFIREKLSVLKSAWIVLIFVFCGYIQVRTSFMHVRLIPAVERWKYQVDGLKLIGKWFHNTLPKNTLMATFPNGAFSYYNELPTLDWGGLTDNNVGRFGEKNPMGKAGHIAHNEKYIYSQRPDIIATMGGAGFEMNGPEYEPAPGYVWATFTFINYTNPIGKYVNITIRKDRWQEIVSYLLRNQNVRLCKPSDI